MIQYTQAIDEIFSSFKTVWDAGATAICGYVPQIEYEGVQGNIVNTNLFWARISEQLVLCEQATLNNGENQINTCTGLVFVQIFCPLSDTQSKQKGLELAMLAKTAFRKRTSTGNVWFRNAIIKKVPKGEKHRQINVISEYIFDEIA